MSDDERLITPKIVAIGKIYISFTHHNPTKDMALFMERVIDIIEELVQDIEVKLK